MSRAVDQTPQVSGAQNNRWQLLLNLLVWALLVVLPLLNDLRSARGQALLSETSLFSPPLQVVPALDAEALAHLQPEDLPRRWSKAWTSRW